MSSMEALAESATDIDPQTRFAIEDAMSDYAHAIDDDDLERWPDFFAEDGTYKIISRENAEAGMKLGIMACEGRGMMQDRIRALRDANFFEPHTYCHLLGRTSFSSGGDGIRTRTNFSVIRTMQNGDQFRFATGKYLDEWVIDNGRPLLRSRTAVLESRRIDILLVIPL